MQNNFKASLTNLRLIIKSGSQISSSFLSEIRNVALIDYKEDSHKEKCNYKQNDKELKFMFAGFVIFYLLSFLLVPKEELEGWGGIVQLALAGVGCYLGVLLARFLIIKAEPVSFIEIRYWQHNHNTDKYPFKKNLSNIRKVKFFIDTINKIIEQEGNQVYKK